MGKLTVIVPCFNEGESLSELIKQIREVSLDIIFIIVDNGSTDETQKIWKGISIPKNVKYVRKDINTGYGAGIKFGLSHVKTAFAGWMHADLQQDISVI